jgi:hypothetical protein
MSLALMDCVSDIVRMVEDTTGVKVIPMERSDLPVQARLELADESFPEHRLMYRSGYDAEINYIIANQCAHVLRLFAADEASRFLSVTSRQTMMTYLLQIEGELKHLSAIYGPEGLKQFVLLWYQGVVFQLTKMPTDIMIDRWLYNLCPELRPVQKDAILKQRTAAVRSLAPEWREMTPSIINYTSNMMNYAYFKILEDLFGADFVAPYHSTVFIMDGRELLNRTLDRDLSDDHQGDRKRIDSWAEFLNLSGWYEWVPFREHPGPSSIFPG